MTQPALSARERKYVTVLFADIVKSSDMVRGLDPETVESIFNEVISQQIQITEKHQGVVNQVMGDGLMCLFGAKAPFEDHALRAVAAGQEMVTRISEIKIKNKGFPIKIRVGINTGEVVITPARSHHYGAAFQATGQTVHITDRIIKKAEANQMIISEFTKTFIEKYYTCKKVNELTWDVKQNPIDIYTTTARSVAPSLDLISNEYISIERPVVKNVIKTLFSTPKASSSKMIWLYGPAGSGKTHVMHHIMHTHSSSLDTCIKIDFFPEAISNISSSFTKITLEQLFGNENDGLVKNIYKSDDKNIFRSMPFFEDILFDLLGDESVNRAYEELPPLTRGILRSKMFSQLILHACNKKKVLLILEDMHWAKEDVLYYIKNLIKYGKNTQNLYIFATSRNKPPFDREIIKNKVKEVFLDPMNAKEAMQLLFLLDKEQRLSVALKRKVHTLSDGNPYFIAEYYAWIKSNLSQGMSLQKVKEFLEHQAPGKISDILYNKLAFAGSELIDIAKAASVLGMKVSLEILHNTLKISRRDIIIALTRLEDADILRKERSFPDQEWIFTHELLQKVIYHSIPRLIRIQWHSAVLRGIKFLDIENKYLLMSFHAQKAESPLLTYIYSKKAAHSEDLQSRHRSCINLSRQARKALKDIPALTKAKKHEFRCRLLEMSGLFILGRYAEVNMAIQYLLENKRTLIEIGKFEYALSLKELYLNVKGDLKGAEKISKTILSITCNNETYIREHSRLASIYVDLGQYRDAIQHDLKVIQSVPDADFDKKFGLLVQAKPVALSLLSFSYAELGDFKKSLLYLNRAYDLLNKSNDDFTKTFAFIYLSFGLITQNKNQEALNILKQAQSHSEKIDAALLKPYVLSGTGIVLVRMGHIKEGVRFCEEAIRHAARKKIITGKALFKKHLAEALSLGGNQIKARAYLRQVITLARHTSEISTLISAHYLMGRSYIETNSLNMKLALHHLKKARALASKEENNAAKETISAFLIALKDDQKLSRVLDQ